MGKARQAAGRSLRFPREGVTDSIQSAQQRKTQGHLAETDAGQQSKPKHAWGRGSGRHLKKYWPSLPGVVDSHQPIPNGWRNVSKDLSTQRAMSPTCWETVNNTAGQNASTAVKQGLEETTALKACIRSWERSKWLFTNQEKIMLNPIQRESKRLLAWHPQQICQVGRGRVENSKNKPMEELARTHRCWAARQLE